MRAEPVLRGLSQHRNSDAVRSLSEEAPAIDVIAETVRTIAVRSNLLALNAALEASRAQESGRGFTDVAQEMRSPAEGVVSQGPCRRQRGRACTRSRWTSGQKAEIRSAHKVT
ncbi:MAG: methyl-accepting chemotaxis protein [Myxococcaceae bacterium]